MFTQRTAFPRLYVPPTEAPEVTHVPVVYHGKRSAFGPVTVYRVSASHEIVSDNDWRGEGAVRLARDLLHDLMLSRDEEHDEAFAREVLAKLSGEAWELSAQDISDWHSRWSMRNEEERCNYPPTFDADEELPGREDDARMLDLVKKLRKEL